MMVPFEVDVLGMVSVIWDPTDFMTSSVLEQCVNDSKAAEVVEIYKPLTTIVFAKPVLSHHMSEQPSRSHFTGEPLS